jgi:hypothetical protein
MGFASGVVKAAWQALHALGLFALLAFCAVLSYLVLTAFITLIRIAIAVIGAIVS